MKQYSETMKARMVARLVGPRAVSATALSRETGVSQATLSRWLSGAANLGGMTSEQDRGAGAGRPRTAPDTTGARRRSSVRTGAEKLALVARAAELTGEELGGFLRTEGVHLAEVEQWRKVAEDALGAAKRLAPSKETRRLKAELARKDKALAETAALLVLKKKVAAIWGDEDDDTDGRSEP
jgi:transposase